MPNSGRLELLYLCAGLYVLNGHSDRKFRIVMRIESVPNRRAVGLASLVACGEQNVSYGHLGPHCFGQYAMPWP
jgi:hypothetical protein